MMTVPNTEAAMTEQTIFPLQHVPGVRTCADEGLDRAKAAAALAELSRAFGIPAPKLAWTNTRRGKYRWGVGREVGTVIMGPRVWHGWHTLVHEFAHHLDRTRKQFAPAAPSLFFRFARRAHHGPDFSNALVESVKVAFRNVNDYAWHTEYRVVQTWWRNNGHRHGRVAPAGTIGLPVMKPIISIWHPGTLTPALAFAAPTPVATPTPKPKPKRYDPWREVDQAAKRAGFCRGAGPGYRADLVRFCIEHGITYPGQRTAAGY